MEDLTKDQLDLALKDFKEEVALIQRAFKEESKEVKTTLSPEELTEFFNEAVLMSPRQFLFPTLSEYAARFLDGLEDSYLEDFLKSDPEIQLEWYKASIREYFRGV